MCGFSRFYVADNGSTDGQREILEALSELGKVELLYQPVIEEGVQKLAYSRIAEQAVDEVDAILFIDADEFLVHESLVDGAAYDNLHELLMRPEVGMVAINWRCFGSSGLEFNDGRLVTGRFTKCLADKPNSKNCLIKSISKIAYTQRIGPHKSQLKPPLVRVTADGAPLSGFISFENGEAVPAELSDVIEKPVAGPLRVHYYIIKSKQEFLANKANQSRAQLGHGHFRKETYFADHDFYDDEFSFPLELIARLKAKMDRIDEKLQNGVPGRSLEGKIDVFNRSEVRGWLVDEYGSSKGLKVNIVVNGVHQGVASCEFFKPHLKNTRLSEDGICGFYWTHPKPLEKGDVVELQVFGNRFQFGKSRRVVV